MLSKEPSCSGFLSSFRVGLCGPQPYRHAVQSAAVYTLLCYHKLVVPCTTYSESPESCQHTFHTHTYVNTGTMGHHHFSYTQYCVQDTIRHRHICVCALEVAKILQRSLYREVAMCSYHLARGPHRHRFHAAIRLQKVLSGFR